MFYSKIIAGAFCLILMLSWFSSFLEICILSPNVRLSAPFKLLSTTSLANVRHVCLWFSETDAPSAI